MGIRRGIHIELTRRLLMGMDYEFFVSMKVRKKYFRPFARYEHHGTTRPALSLPHVSHPPHSHFLSHCSNVYVDVTLLRELRPNAMYMYLIHVRVPILSHHTSHITHLTSHVHTTIGNRNLYIVYSL